MNLTASEPVPTVLISGAQPRVVLRISSPTGTYRLPWQSIAHWSIIVGNPGSEGGVLRSDMVRNGDKVTHETMFHVRLPSANAKHAVVLGYTGKTDEEIRSEGENPAIRVMFLVRY